VIKTEEQVRIELQKQVPIDEPETETRPRKTLPPQSVNGKLVPNLLGSD